MFKMLKISTEIDSAAKIIGEEKAVEYYAKAGFDAWDFSMFEMVHVSSDRKSIIKTNHPLCGENYLAFARRLKKIGEDNGIECNQSHAPFPTHIPEMRSYLKRSIECTAEAGGKICIIHPMNKASVEENTEMFNELLPFAKQYGVKIASENMWEWDAEKDQVKFAACMTPENFNAHLDAVNDEFFVACLDIGHAEMRGANTSAPEMIKALGKRLCALHIHDNDKRHDSHQIPFSMQIDFDVVVRALKEIGYNGYLTLEADQYLKDYNKDNVFEGMKDLAGAAIRIRNMF